MNLEETLDKIVELSREELHIVRKRGEEKTAAREHGHDYHEMQRAADRLEEWVGKLSPAQLERVRQYAERAPLNPVHVIIVAVVCVVLFILTLVTIVQFVTR